MSVSTEELRRKIKSALELALKTKRPWRYRQSIELIISFRGVDIKKQQEFKFRDNIELPHGLGRAPRICLAIEDDLAQQYANLVYMVIPKSRLETLTKKESKSISRQCDFVLARASLMGLVGKVLGPALGPRGKAPVVIPANADIVSFITRYEKMTKLRTKDQPWVGCKVGTEELPIDHIVENVIAVLHYVEEKIKRPLSQVARIYVKTSSSPAIEV